MEETLKSVRTETHKWAVQALGKAVPVEIEWSYTGGRNGVRFRVDGEEISLPRTAGVYVLYAKTSSTPVYVGESGSLHRRMRNHCFAKGSSVFRKRWVARWLKSLGKKHDEQSISRFISEMIQLRYLSIPFGRRELEDDLKHTYDVVLPASVDPKVLMRAR